MFIGPRIIVIFEKENYSSTIFNYNIHMLLLNEQGKRNWGKVTCRQTALYSGTTMTLYR